MSESNLRFLVDAINESAGFSDFRLGDIMSFDDVCDQEIDGKNAYAIGYDRGFNEGKVEFADYLVRLINAIKEEEVVK